MLCNKKTGLWISVVFGILVALGVFNQSHATTNNFTQFKDMTIAIRGQGVALIFIAV